LLCALLLPRLDGLEFALERLEFFGLWRLAGSDKLVEPLVGRPFPRCALQGQLFKVVDALLRLLKVTLSRTELLVYLSEPAVGNRFGNLGNFRFRVTALGLHLFFNVLGV
jgi:hypothetical protein